MVTLALTENNVDYYCTLPVRNLCYEWGFAVIMFKVQISHCTKIRKQFQVNKVI